MKDNHAHGRHTDSRIILYRIALHSAAIVALVYLVKILLLDVVSIQGDQMAPSITIGDRALVLRAPYLPLVRDWGLPGRGKPVIFSEPFENKRGCLRVAGVSGDRVAVDSGVFKNRSAPRLALPFRRAKNDAVLPPEYSPRDFLPPHRVPAPGDTLTFGSADLFALFSAIQIVRQEDPSAAYSLRVGLTLDSSPAANYSVRDFSLYKGPLDSVPDAMRYDWFFWNRLRVYLRQAESGRSADLAFTFTKNGEKLARYVVKKKYVFLLADNWKDGLDSRFFGPVAVSNLFGRPVAVLWSFTGPGNGAIKINAKRFGRIIR